MKKKRHRISIKDIREFTDEEVLENKRKLDLLFGLGIMLGYDDVGVNDEKTFLSVSTLYKSLYDYEVDKSEASIMITEKKPIPEELYDKLLKTKEELEKAGLI